MGGKSAIWDIQLSDVQASHKHTEHTHGTPPSVHGVSMGTRPAFVGRPPPTPLTARFSCLVSVKVVAKMTEEVCVVHRNIASRSERREAAVVAQLAHMDEMKAVRSELKACYLREGVNHGKKCSELLARFLEISSKPLYVVGVTAACPLHCVVPCAPALSCPSAHPTTPVHSGTAPRPCDVRCPSDLTPKQNPL